MTANEANTIFNQSIRDYHVNDDVDASIQNPYETNSLEKLLYQKNWIDTVQWHLEDIIRDPNIEPVAALEIKRRIDKSNQDRTDLVEQIDDYFYDQFEPVSVKDDATINTESPAWALDRLSILALKIYHMNEEANRKEASHEHQNTCNQKLAILQSQQNDLSTAIDQLLTDMQEGKKYMKVYKQMKMYNDPNLNPVLYSNKDK